MIDTNVDLFEWPFRRLIGDHPAELVRQLRWKGVIQAWASSYEALLCRDVAGVNIRLVAACREHGEGFLVPFGCVNPKSPDWEEDLRRCHEIHHMAGIRLHPGYHGYTLADADFAKLLSEAANRHLVVQVALSMEDPRTQFPLMKVPPVDPAPLIDLIPRIPNLRLVLLNAQHSGPPYGARIPSAIEQANNIYFDIAMNEGVVGLARLIAATSSSRVLFGSHYPFFYFESALLKIQGAGLPEDQANAVLEGNARALLEQGVG
ncbi:MAG: amidohydrolase family protein [Terriglobia bacterium]